MAENVSVLDNDGDVTVLYQGGSGGFFFYFYLLLSGNFISGDELIYSSKSTVFSTLSRISKQFNYDLLGCKKQWKSYETWPDNDLCLKLDTDKQKLCLICNPLFNPNVLPHNLRIVKKTTPVLIYIDLDTQLRLSYDKQAYWFTETSKKQFAFRGNMKEYIKSIKSNFSYFQGIKVDPMIPRIVEIFKPRHIFNLRDVLDFHHNPYQESLVTRWLSLESKKSLIKLGKHYVR